MQHAASIVAADTKVVDLAADFRLQNLLSLKNGMVCNTAVQAVLKDSVYGLTELNREQIKQAEVIGNPGCYPTTVQLGLAPLFKKSN